MGTRRRFLRAGVAGMAALAGCARGGSDGGVTPPATAERTTDTGARTERDGPPSPTPASEGLPVRLETVTGEVGAPVAFEVAPDGTRYVADQRGRLLTVGDDGAVETALDLADAVVAGGERGLLGLALHPEFNRNGRLYVRYSAPSRPDTPGDYSHTFVLAEFEAADGGDVRRGSERTLLEVPQPQRNHNSGSVAFGPDGHLYVGVGDGGAGGDAGTGHVEDWYDANGGGNGQDVTENLLGSVLRLDVDGRDGDRAYAIPDDNPLVGREGLDEHYAWGLRNPWGMSFDGEDLYVADVGQNRYEEVNRVERGGNYGWNVREGAHCFGADSCPAEAPDGAPLIDPVIEYPHSGGAVSGSAVIGGYRYRGDAIGALSGRYVFGDLNARGRLFVAAPSGEGLWPAEVLEVAEADRGKLSTLLAFGRDPDGELYALTRGGVHRIAPSA